MKKAIAVSLAVVVVTAAVLGATQVGEAAVGAAKVALFAKNSAKLNGLGASKTPKPGRLLPLGKNGRFPASVVPAVVGPVGRKGNPGSKDSRAPIATPSASKGKTATSARRERPATSAPKERRATSA